MSENSDINQKLMDACESGNLDEVRRLVEAGADVNFNSRHDFRPLLMAAYYGHAEVARFLIARGADANYAEFVEGTALQFAAGSGNADLTSVLLEAGADANVALPRSGETALHVAVFSDRTEIVRLLLAAGAEVNRQAKADADTELFDGGVKLQAEAPLHFAGAYAGVATIEALLEAGADRTLANAYGETPIVCAGRHRRPREIIQLLK